MLARNGAHLPGDALALLEHAQPGYGFDVRTGAGYNGGICLAYVHGAWMRQDEVDCLGETVALRDELRQDRAGGS
jgi:hypothetical protein